MSPLLAPGRLSSLHPESAGFSVALDRGRGSTRALRARRRADPGFAARLGGGQLAMGGALAVRLAERLGFGARRGGRVAHLTFEPCGLRAVRGSRTVGFHRYGGLLQRSACEPGTTAL